MIKVGLTGGIGSGKTTVANYFIELGVPIYFADYEAKKLMNSSADIKNKLIREFGEKTYQNGELNRKYLASIVFNDTSKLNIINGIVHPAVANHFAEWIKKQKSNYIIQENAILFENNTSSVFDYIITVTASIDVKIERILKRDSGSKNDILSRMKNQWDDLRKIDLSDFVIHNIGLADTKKQVGQIHKKLLKIAISKNNS
ncbi:MAG: dephospho-CoA kinase [Aureibaculum sp.]|nr:dephospho-CoA kinase [Aureibaculum sp.]